MKPARRRRLVSPRLALLLVAFVLQARAAGDVHAATWSPWPKTNYIPIVPLEHPPLERRVREREAAGGSKESWRFVAFGDQRALADGEWQKMMDWIADLDRERAIDFVVDTGDIVSDGRFTDQFARFAMIVSPMRHRPYLVGVGNHELDHNDTPKARTNTARALSTIDAALSEERLYYRKDAGPATILFLDSNDFIYGPDGRRAACPLEIDPATREGRQLAWLRDQLRTLAADPPPLLVIVLHHPLVQSSERHHEASCSLWNFQSRGENLVDLFADGGVDLVLTGHTHTYERFRLERDDGHVMHQVNLSGRPRSSFLWFGPSDRRATDMRGREAAWLEDMGWIALDHWQVTQEDLMRKSEEADQFAIFTVDADGGLVMEPHFLDEDRERPEGTRPDVDRWKGATRPPVRLK